MLFFVHMYNTRMKIYIIFRLLLYGTFENAKEVFIFIKMMLIENKIDTPNNVLFLALYMQFSRGTLQFLKKQLRYSVRSSLYKFQPSGFIT